MFARMEIVMGVPLEISMIVQMAMPMVVVQMEVLMIVVQIELMIEDADMVRMAK